MWPFCGLGHRHDTKKNSYNIKDCRSCAFTVYFCDPLGVRTQDPNIKSVVLYQLS